MSSTNFDGVIAKSVLQNMHYEKLNLLSKLISKLYIQLHIEVGISYSFSLSMFIKFCMQVEDTYIYIYMGSSKTHGRSQGHVTSALMCSFFKKNKQ